ncbi:MAG: tetratricopeptide repeat protein, partial [Xenococcus sp. (in: cyanobacteria)]
MKRLLPLIASVVLFPTPLLIAPSLVVAETAIIALEIEPELRENMRSISVKITSSSQGGSGVIIGKQNDQYLIITNNHVVRGAENFTIETADGANHQAALVSNPITSDDDIALLTFNSNNSYKVAQLNGAATGKEEQDIFAVGYSSETGQFIVEPGIINKIPQQPLKEGYQIGYTSNVVSGMSGGAIFNAFGDLIGINGISSFPILNTAYEYQDGTKPTPEEIEQLRQLSWGLSLHRLLTQVKQQIITAYDLPLPDIDNIGTTQLTGWVADLANQVKPIIVRIDSTSGGNGSGVIVAKEGNSYAVLTADHVICEKDEETKDCIGHDYKIFTHDGKEYSLDSIQRQEGVDLAVVRFTSNENYQVAQLANYPVKNDDVIFVAGYPQLSNNSSSQWKFSPGFGLEKEWGLLNVDHNVDQNSQSTEGSSSQSSKGSLSGGYEMVYTSITYGGMSGGAVLDRDGRVIGIHGAAEGETTFNSQGSSSDKIHLGYSLGIPINSFIGLVDKFKINSRFLVQESFPRKLNQQETEVFTTAILGTDIPQENATAKRWLERGNQLWRLKRYEEAVQAFDRVIDLEPEFFIHLAYYGKGLAFRDGAEYTYEAALESFELATRSKPNFAPAFSEKSLVLRYLERLDEALVAIDKAISLEKGNANQYYQKATILGELKRYSEAEAAYQKAIGISSRAAFYNSRGLLYDEQGKLELAEADFNKAIELNPQDNKAYNNRGILYSSQGKLELAEANYNKAIKLYPQDAIVHYNRGLLYDNQGKVELALADYTKAIEFNPQYAPAYDNRGIVYANQGKLELAEADFNKAIELYPQYATNAYYNRGLLYDNQGKVELALADYTKAIEFNPQYVKAYVNRGILYDNQGKVELALADYTKAIEFNPQY